MKKQVYVILFVSLLMILFGYSGCKQPVSPEEPKDETAPAEVTNPSINSGNEKVTLSWTNPSDKDFCKVLISYNGTSKEVNKSNSSIELAGLENGTNYSFLLQTVDITGNKSVGIKISGMPVYQKVLPEVSGLTYTTDNGKITLNWSNPSDNDFTKVVIFYDDQRIDIEKSQQTEAGQCSREITNLTNDKVYTFNIKTVDKKGEMSNGVKRDISLYKLTNEVIENGSYIKFGDWPQSLKDNNVNLSKETTSINGWTCFYGSDGYYYVKLTPTPNEENYTFDNGTKIEKSKEFYFRLEPIKWDVITNKYVYDASGNKTGKLLLSQKVLAAHNFSKSNTNKYIGSDIETYLSSEFLQKAFAEKVRASIADINTGNENLGQVFLLSDKEVTDAGYGFKSYNEQDSKRFKKASDYAKATGVYVETSQKNYLNNSGWWLRTPDLTGTVHSVRFDSIVNTIDVQSNFGGVAPAIVLPEKTEPAPNPAEPDEGGTEATV